jgi:hypothetical protein
LSGTWAGRPTITTQSGYCRFRPFRSHREIAAIDAKFGTGVARWVENPYHHHFTGGVFFQHKHPIDPSSLTRWRKRTGEEGVEWLLTQTIEAGRKSGAID